MDGLADAIVVTRDPNAPLPEFTLNWEGERQAVLRYHERRIHDGLGTHCGMICYRGGERLALIQLGQMPEQHRGVLQFLEACFGAMVLEADEVVVFVEVLTVEAAGTGLALANKRPIGPSEHAIQVLAVNAAGVRFATHAFESSNGVVRWTTVHDDHEAEVQSHWMVDMVQPIVAAPRNSLTLPPNGSEVLDWLYRNHGVEMKRYQGASA